MTGRDPAPGMARRLPAKSEIRVGEDGPGTAARSREPSIYSEGGTASSAISARLQPISAPMMTSVG
jgi:hypothetical protein